MYMYVRLKPYSPRTNHLVQRLHYRGHLFVGGARPTWYRVTAEAAQDLQTLRQDSGTEMFDIVNEATKLEIDQIEQHRHMAALGIAAATVAAPMQRQPVDLTGAPPPSAPAPLVATPAPAQMPVIPAPMVAAPSPIVAIPTEAAPGRTAAIPPSMPVTPAGFAAVPLASAGGGDLTTADFKDAKDKG